MAYVVTSVTTKGNVSDPDFNVWYETMLDPNVVYNQFPNLTGQPISSIVQDEIDKLYDPTDGFVSQEVHTSDDSSVYTLVTTYEDQSNVIQSTIPLKEDIPHSSTFSCSGNISFSKNSAIITGTNTYFTSDLEIGDVIIAQFQMVNVFFALGIVSSIESNTSLTLSQEAIMPEDWDARMDQWGRPRDFIPSIPYVKKGGSRPDPTPLEFIQNLYNETYPNTTETTYANV